MYNEKGKDGFNMRRIQAKLLFLFPDHSETCTTVPDWITVHSNLLIYIAVPSRARVGSNTIKIKISPTDINTGGKSVDNK